MSRTKKDYPGLEIGTVINSLTIKSEVYNLNGFNVVKAECICGKTKPFRVYPLLDKTVRSCGCIRILNNKQKLTKHGQAGNRLYTIWRNMKKRCLDSSNRYYCNYGGRGIKICEDWMNASNFIKWAFKNGYNDTLTIDRIDNDKDYCPENCKWSTKHEQERNMRKNRFFTYNGETKIFNDWVRDPRCQVAHTTLWTRIHERGWSFEDALLTPPLNR